MMELLQREHYDLPVRFVQVRVGRVLPASVKELRRGRRA
jgi:hypothetical protein